MTLSAEDKKGIKSEFGRSSKDTGSPEVQSCYPYKAN